MTRRAYSASLRRDFPNGDEIYEGFVELGQSVYRRRIPAIVHEDDRSFIQVDFNHPLLARRSSTRSSYCRLTDE